MSKITTHEIQLDPAQTNALTAASLVVSPGDDRPVSSVLQSLDVDLGAVQSTVGGLSGSLATLESTVGPLGDSLATLTNSPTLQDYTWYNHDGDGFVAGNEVHIVDGNRPDGTNLTWGHALVLTPPDLHYAYLRPDMSLAAGTSVPAGCAPLWRFFYDSDRNGWWGQNARVSASVAAVMGGGGGDQIGDIVTSLDRPSGGEWLPCDGSLRSKAAYPELFQRLGHLDQLTGNHEYRGSIPNATQIAYGNGVHVAIGINVIGTSQDGLRWTYRDSGINANLNDIAFGSGVFVVSVYGAEQPLLISSDGVSWEPVFAPGPTYGPLIYAGDKFILFSSTGNALVSSDGRSWTAVFTGIPLAPLSVAYGNGAIMVACDGATMYRSTDGLTWAGVGGVNEAVSVAFGQDRFVAATYGGTIHQSTDGLTWSKTSDFGPFGFDKHFCYARGRFYFRSTDPVVYSSTDLVAWKVERLQLVAAVDNGQHVAALDTNHRTYTSEDGLVWATVGHPFHSYTTNDATYGNGLFVIVGNSGTLATSPDGTVWSTRDAGFGTSHIYGVAYGNGKFIAVGQDGKVASSLDGETWVQMAALSAFTGGQPVRVRFGHDRFLIVGNGFSGVLITGPGDENWLSRASQFGASIIRDAAYGTGRYVIVGDGGKIAVSTDGIAWELKTNPFGTNAIHGITYADGLFVAVGAGGLLATSTDASSWVLQDAKLGTVTIRSVAYGLGRFVAIGDSGNMATSHDGLHWILHPPSLATSALFGAAASPRRFLAVGASGEMRVSSDGLNWAQQHYAPSSTLSNRTLNDITNKNGQLVVVGNGGFIATSHDGGQTWVKQSSGQTGDLHAVVATPSAFIAAGAGGVIITSPDGVVWTPRSSPFTSLESINDLSASDTVVVAVGFSGKIATSGPTGITWQQRTSPHGATEIVGVAYGNGTFTFVTHFGHVATSSDGASWTARPAGASNGFRKGLAFNGRHFAFTDTGNLVRQSPDGITWSSTGLYASASRLFPAHNHKIVCLSNSLAASLLGSDGSHVRWSHGTNYYLRAAIPYQDQIVAVGAKGLVAIGRQPPYTTNDQFRLPMAPEGQLNWIKAKE